MSYIPGQFDGVDSVQLGVERHPHLNLQPVGEYVLRLLEASGFKTNQTNADAFRASFEVLSAPEGAANHVTVLAINEGPAKKYQYYFKDLKAVTYAAANNPASVLRSGAVSEEEIDAAAVQALCEGVFDGMLVRATVREKTRADGTTYGVHRISPLSLDKARSMGLIE